MKVLVFNCRKVLEINCRKLLVSTCFLQQLHRSKNGEIPWENGDRIPLQKCYKIEKSGIALIFRRRREILDFVER